MTVKRSDREVRWPAGLPASRWFSSRRKRIELETVVAEVAVTEIPRPEQVTLEREWNIWDLERLARAQPGDPARDQEWAALFMHLRQFANADGVLPTQFDGLVRESFSRLIQAA
jgi:hypothetical protein